MGLSLNQIKDTFALLLPKGRADRSTVGHWVRHAEHQAGHVLTALDAVARPRAETMALDEIFFRRQPCLVGVEPASMALLLCRRSAGSYGGHLEAGVDALHRAELCLHRRRHGPAKGAGRGGCRRRQQDRPPLERGLDHFHTAQEAQRILGRLWKRVRPAGTRPRKPTASAARFKARVTTAADPRPARVAWKRVADARAWYDGRAAAWQRARQALTLLGPTANSTTASKRSARLPPPAWVCPGGRGRRCVLSSRIVGR